MVKKKTKDIHPAMLALLIICPVINIGRLLLQQVKKNKEQFDWVMELGFYQ